jgi:3-dehydroquinate dehydratase-2
LIIKKINIANGPNLNFLGIRELEKYGSTTYAELIHKIESKALSLNLEVEFFQSNKEGEIVDYIQTISHLNDSWLIFNPGAFTHTSVSIRDAVSIFSQNNKIVEVHISDINKREDFRKINLIKKFSNHSIIGQGVNGYLEALEYIDGE